MIENSKRNKDCFRIGFNLGFILVLLIAVFTLTSCTDRKKTEQPTGNLINPESKISLIEHENQKKFIIGQRNNKDSFQILLPEYATVLLNQTEFYDLTGDSQMELCVGLNIANTATPDINAIHVFDSMNLKLLFPTEDKSAVYDGEIVSLKQDGFPNYAINYTSFSKTHAIAFTDEISLIAWMDGGFTTLKYQKKLMNLDAESTTAVFLEDYSRYEMTSNLKLSVEKIGDPEQDVLTEKIQEITVQLGDEVDWASIDQKVEAKDLAFFSGWDGDGDLDLVIRPYADVPDDIKEIVYVWNSENKLFECAYDLEDTDLSSWIGAYSYFLFYPPNITISVDMELYENNDIYYGYLQASGFQTFERMTVLIKGDEKKIYVYAFDVNPDTFSSSQKGELLFTLKKDGDNLLTRWNHMYFDEKSGAWEEQFKYSNRWHWKDETDGEGDTETFLRMNGFVFEEDPPFFQYYDDKGDLQIDLYYDERTCSGAGFGSDLFRNHGFSFEGYFYETWAHDKFSSDYNGIDGSASVDDYKESWEYNDSGLPVHYKSEGTIGWLKDNPGTYPIIEIQYHYREDGTLRKKTYNHNPYIFGSTNQYTISYYDSLERLEHVSSYINSGSIEEYYIYQENSMEPSYSLRRDRMGGGSFIKYGLYEVIEAKG